MEQVLHTGGIPKRFSEKENGCKLLFNQQIQSERKFYHLFTSGVSQQILFQRKETYIAGMNLLATSAFDSLDIRIITFELMSNHLHIIVLGDEAHIRSFFQLFARRLNLYFKKRRQVVDLSGFREKLILIDSLESLRNQIAYTNRNNYLADPGETPFSYPYGANSFYFSPWMQQVQSRLFGSMTIREKRDVTLSHNVDYPRDAQILNGYFSPAGYCDTVLGERMFRDARHYFHKISRDIESYREVAANVGDSIYYTDDELNAVVYGLCMKKYRGEQPALLSSNEKMELARTLHYDYNADNEKIGRILRLPLNHLAERFPERR